MTLRTFTGTDGTVWNVWNVVPTVARESNTLTLASGMAEGWLCFESAAAKRRLAPIPPGWDEWSDEELERCMMEVPVVQRRPRPTPPDEPAAPMEAAAPEPPDVGMAG